MPMESQQVLLQSTKEVTELPSAAATVAVAEVDAHLLPHIRPHGANEGRHAGGQERIQAAALLAAY